MWDQIFAKETYVYGRQPSEFLVEQCRQWLPGDPLDVLCLGEGEGRNSVFLAGLGHHVHAVDGSSVARDKARQLACESQVELTYDVADLGHYPFRKTYQLMVMIFCHLPLSVRQALHRQMVSHLGPGGFLIYQAYTPQQLSLGTGGPKQLDMLVKLSELERDFSSFDVLLSRQNRRMLTEGINHTGLGDVAEFVARKPLA
ncbi:MAG: hypothetical protein CENE_01601 [Candidatus Celerinatantimonas neptuna]|nr:MAG: hypothetical protein CENE_01601 [Candidatus Celerinatantimonas neptuna]